MAVKNERESASKKENSANIIFTHPFNFLAFLCERRYFEECPGFSFLV